MQPEARSGRVVAAQAHPLAELLRCPAETRGLLNGAAVCIEAAVGEVIFRQSGVCLGLYVVISGQFLRRAERFKTRITLGVARAGDLLELAAVLGDGLHTYTLSAQTSASALLLPIEAMKQAFAAYPPLRKRLLEELAREVSRGYEAGCKARDTKTRRPGRAGSCALSAEPK